MARITREVRSALPGLDLSDDELENVIAREAIGAGYNISFDRKAVERAPAPKN